MNRTLSRLPSAAFAGDAPLCRYRIALAFASTTLYLLLCFLLEVKPDHPIILTVLALAALHPALGMGFVMAVMTVPLGFWLLGVERYAADMFGGREYALSLSGLAILAFLTLRAVTRTRLDVWRGYLPAAVSVAVILVWGTLNGFRHHGLAQTAVGMRILLVPIAALLVFVTMSRSGLRRLFQLLSWLMIANAVAAVLETAVGPARLVAWGFEDGRAVRVIGDTFRAPGLTEFNAELGALAGAFLLGYAALWLTGRGRLLPAVSHAAAGAGLVALVLSTSRSGVLMLAGGVTCAIVLDRAKGSPARRRARTFGLVLVGGAILGFAALGATGSSSLIERLSVWWQILRSNLSLFGSGVGSAGSATYSRAADGPGVFVDNYFLNVAIQFGPLVLAALLVAIVVTFKRLSARTATDHTAGVPLAVLGGVVLSFLVLETWEFSAAMMCLALFLVLNRKLRPTWARSAQARQASAVLEKARMWR